MRTTKEELLVSEDDRSSDEALTKLLQCIMCSAPLRLHEQNLHSIPKKPVPFDTVHIDHMGPLPSVKSKQNHVLVVIDAFTKYVKLYPANSTSTKEVIRSLEKYFGYYSRPRRIISDRGTCFTSLEFESFLLKNNVTHVKVATASPQANGQVERVNRVLTPMLSKLTDPLGHSDWVTKLAEVEYAMNNSVHSTTRKSPSNLLFGVEQRGKIVDELTEYLEDKNETGDGRILEEIRARAAEAITVANERNEKAFLERSIPAKTFEAGEYVVIRHIDTTAGRNKKLLPKYRGPYVIHKILPNDRYVVRDIENCQVTQIPYDGVVEAARIRRWLSSSVS